MIGLKIYISSLQIINFFKEIETCLIREHLCAKCIVYHIFITIGIAYSTLVPVGYENQVVCFIDIWRPEIPNTQKQRL